MCGPDCVFVVIRWVAPCWPVGAAGLTSTVASAAVILAVRNVPSVLLASSWSPSVQSTQTESARLALQLRSHSFMTVNLVDINRAYKLT